MKAPEPLNLPNRTPVMNLCNTTLFPQAVLPLYIFEERYKTMLDEVLEDQRLFAIADLESSENAETETFNSKIAGIGIVRACRKNSDGTAHLILQGLARVKINQIFWDKPYPQADIQTAKSTRGEDGADYLSMKPKLIDSIERLIQLNPKLPEDILPFLANLDEPESVLDIAIASLCPSGEFKQTLLETLNIQKRYQAFHGFLKKEKESILLNKKLLGGMDENDTKNN